MVHIGRFEGISQARQGFRGRVRRRNGNVVVNVVVVRRKTIVVNVHRVETIRVTRSVNYADVID
jgi:hypothetical protein